MKEHTMITHRTVNNAKYKRTFILEVQVEWLFSIQSVVQNYFVYTILQLSNTFLLISSELKMCLAYKILQRWYMSFLMGESKTDLVTLL